MGISEALGDFISEEPELFTASATMAIGLTTIFVGNYIIGKLADYSVNREMEKYNL